LRTSTNGNAGSDQESSAAKLAALFPGAKAVGLPVRLTRMGAAVSRSENAVIEFATPREVLFVCSSPLEFADRVRLQSSDGLLDEEASVVAVRYHEGDVAVAARFLRRVANWIVKL
jgi:hypothetical protein